MNHILRAASRKLTLLVCAGLLSTGLCSTKLAAQGIGSVVESKPFSPGQTRPVAATPATSNSATPNNDALSLLLDQIRDLQTEVQSLRAMVEEQSFELRIMQRDALSRYTNVDERLGNLESAASRSAPAIANSRANPVANSTANSTAN